jgi:hydroxymethylglutaryl-CoA reductase
LVGIDERLHLLKKKFNLTDQETASLIPAGGLNTETADKMSENVVSTASIPLAIIPDLIVNNHEYSVPIATEQRTILPMIKKGIEFTSQSDGFHAENTGSTMIGQIQVLDVSNINRGRDQILLHKDEILAKANTLSSRRKAVDLQVRQLETKVGSSLIVELYVDVKDSMGANIVDEMVETVSPFIAELASGRYNVRVLSNLATERLVRVEVSIDTDVFGRNEIVDDIVAASYFAEADPYRATTHNKGIMNGVSSVLLALGNDIRAVEAGAHAYAALSGQYRPLSIWRKDGGALVGELVMPMAVGIVGGAVSVHPTVRVALKILGVGSATELGEVAASVGLASNLGALHTLVTDGITSIQG